MRVRGFPATPVPARDTGVILNKSSGGEQETAALALAVGLVREFSLAYLRVSGASANLGA